MPITIESAGSHAFDLGHIRRQGGEELLRLLLDGAELPLHLTWRLQVQKKLNCNAETPPVRVVDEPRKWTVHLKIKPGDNNTCHYCSLIMPDGLSGEKLYYQLGKASAELDRNWRHKTVEPTNGAHGRSLTELFSEPPAIAETNAAPKLETLSEVEQAAAPVEAVVLSPPWTMPAETEALCPAPPAPTQAEPSEPANTKSGRARGWLIDADKIRLLLLAIHEINEGGAYPQDHWAELLSQRMDWEGANRHEVGGVLTGLVRRDLIERRFRGSKPYGYVLSEEGQRLIADLIVPTSLPRSSTAVPSAPFLSAPFPPASPTFAAFARGGGSDPADVIRSFGPIAKQFLDATARLEAIARREEELSAELALLKQEREQICRLLDDNQVQSVLTNLARLVQTKE